MKIKSLIVFVIINTILTMMCEHLFAQRKYYISNGTVKDLQQYVGQRVKYFGYGSSAIKFKSIFGGNCDETYTISAVKGGDNYKVELIDSLGTQVTLKISKYSYENTMSHTDMTYFFLVDKFDADKKKYCEIVINNEKDEPVAKVIDVYYLAIKSIPSSFDEPKSFTIKSLLDGSIINTENIESAKQLCSQYGKILSHPIVDTEYIIVGATTTSEKFKHLDSKTQGRNIYISYIKNGYYNVQNTKDSTKKRQVRIDKIENMEENLFKEDLFWTYKYRLVNVERIPNETNNLGEIKLTEDKIIPKYTYSDKLIDISIACDGNEFDFMLQNISSNTLAVNWNNAVFIDYLFNSSSISHSGIKYVERYNYQNPSILLNGDILDDLAVPNCNLKYDNSEWVTESMNPTVQLSDPIQVSLMIPIEVNYNKIYKYKFIFEGKWVYRYPERIKPEYSRE